MDKSSWIISGKVDITRDFPDTEMLRVFQRLNSDHISKDKEYSTFLKHPELHENEFDYFSKNIHLPDTFTINIFSEMISSPTAITDDQLKKILYKLNILLKNQDKSIKNIKDKINFYRDKCYENNALKIIHLIWSSDKLSEKSNKIRVPDLIQLLSNAPVGKTREAIALISKFKSLSEYRKRLARLYEKKE